jgi:lysophospholipase L1-like esterase
MPTPEVLQDGALRPDDWRVVAWDDPALSIRGALHLKPTAAGILPRRLPDWTLAQMPDPALDMMASMPSGVRLVLHTDARRVALEVLERGLRFQGSPRRPAAFDLFVNGALARRLHVHAGQTVVIDGAKRPPSFVIEPGEPSTLVFDDLPAGPKTLEIWLPQSATVELRALRLDGDLLPPAPSPSARRWAHYGSSISHGMEADGPSETWPAVAARAAGADLTSLGLGGQCHLDGMVARALRDADVDLISLKLGINVLNGDSMRERVFIAAAHSFLDTIRDAKPVTPILVVSPILCPAAEDRPGPTLNDGAAIYTLDRPEALALGALTARRIRELLAGIVGRRRAGGDVNLHYLDGLRLFDEADLADLPDGLHPNAAGLRRMGERFATLAFGSGGAFAPASTTE